MLHQAMHIYESENEYDEKFFKIRKNILILLKFLKMKKI